MRLDLRPTLRARARAALVFILAAGLAAVFAQSLQRAGIDRPIRVGQFKGNGTNGTSWHANMHQSGVLLNAILTSPSTMNLGADLVVPVHNPPFVFTSFGVVTTPGGSAPSGGGAPSTSQIEAFITAMDTLDVIVINSMINFETVFATPAQREALLRFTRRKGYLAVHGMTDTYGQWAQGDSLHGTTFRDHPNGDRAGTLRPDSAHSSDRAWSYLNRGLFSAGARDTAFVEEWFYFTTSGADIRAQANLKPTLQFDETSLTGTGFPAPMGDHPYSWYRTYPDSGGRTFYTALGHRPNLWDTGATAPRLFRRQLYNAILWLAKYDSIAKTASIDPTASPFPQRTRLRIERNHLHFTSDFPARVSVRTSDGRRVAQGRGAALSFPLTAGSLYLVTVEARDATFTRRFIVP